MKKQFLMGFMIPFVMSACSDEDHINSEMNVMQEETIHSSGIDVSQKQTRLAEFAGILSKAVAARQDVRDFLKKESLKEFDKNYDVLYALVCDEMIGDETFRDVLVSYSSEEAVSDIENALPLLNIYNARIDVLEVYPEKMDVADNEIPVAFSAYL